MVKRSGVTTTKATVPNKINMKMLDNSKDVARFFIALAVSLDGNCKLFYFVPAAFSLGLILDGHWLNWRSIRR